jgi:hypothetical protein
MSAGSPITQVGSGLQSVARSVCKTAGPNQLMCRDAALEEENAQMHVLPLGHPQLKSCAQAPQQLENDPCMLCDARL